MGQARRASSTCWRTTSRRPAPSATTRASAAPLGELRRTFDDALETLRRDGMPPLASYLLALAVGLGVIAWTSARAGQAAPAGRPALRAARARVTRRAASPGTRPCSPRRGTSRVLAMLELKSALEEDVATRLGLDRPPSRRRARGARTRSRPARRRRRLDELARLLAMLARDRGVLLVDAAPDRRARDRTDVFATAAV